MSDNEDLFAKMARAQVALKTIKHIPYRYNDRTLIFKRGKVQLYHYRSQQSKPHPIPLLVVFATVNRPEILDLEPEHSFIKNLLKNGMDVYLLDWGYADKDDSEISLSDYVTDSLHYCVMHILEKAQLKQINLLGICQGGIISLCYASLYKTIKNLVLISTPIDFHTEDNYVGKLLTKIDVAALTAGMHNISGEWLTNFFISLRPVELIGKKYLRFVDNIDDPKFTARFLQVEKWLNDAPDQTALAFKELLVDLYQQNKLINGKLEIYGRKVQLNNLSIPLLNVMASHDEIVPMSSSRALKKYIHPDRYDEEIFPSGHIGIYISDKVGKRMPQAISKWLKKADKSKKSSA